MYMYATHQFIYKFHSTAQHVSIDIIDDEKKQIYVISE